MSPLYYQNLPDGIHNVLISERGGLYLTGYNSKKRTCLVLYAPPYGEQLRVVSELPYSDYGRFAPTVLAAHDPLREELYVLLYQQPDNLGIEQMSLFRIDPAKRTQQLLSAIPSPFWRPTAMVPRRDGSVLVALSGLGPILRYAGCNSTSCDAPAELKSLASDCNGKAGMVEVGEVLYLVIDSDPVYGTGGHLVYQRPDGSMHNLSIPHAASDGNKSITSDALENANSGSMAGRQLDFAFGSFHEQPTLLEEGPAGSLLVVGMEFVNEFGYSRGSVYLVEPRDAQPNEACAAHGCWNQPRAIATSLSNPRGVAVDEGSNTLFVVEQNTLTGYSFEPFKGDVLTFCISGRYDCASAQNSGECPCARDYGGPCCDAPLRAGLVVNMLALAGTWSTLVPPLLAATMIMVFGLRRAARRHSHELGPDPHPVSSHGKDMFSTLREPLHPKKGTPSTAFRRSLATSVHRALNHSSDTHSGFGELSPRATESTRSLPEGRRLANEHTFNMLPDLYNFSHAGLEGLHSDEEGPYDMGRRDTRDSMESI